MDFLNPGEVAVLLLLSLLLLLLLLMLMVVEVVDVGVFTRDGAVVVE